MVIPDENAFIAKAQVPMIFRVIISINPLTYAIDSLRNLINDGYVNWAEYGISIGLFGFLGLTAFCIAKNAIRREV